MVHGPQDPGPGDCWLWIGAVADDGDGRCLLRWNGRDSSVCLHRYADDLATGTPFDGGEVLRRLCTIPGCVRPDPADLILGTLTWARSARIGWIVSGMDGPSSASWY